MIGFLLEHYAGAFPVWLSPEQVRIIPITDEQIRLRRRSCTMPCTPPGVRAELDLDAERMNAKIRKAQMFKVPYMVVLGKREVAETVWPCASATARNWCWASRSL